MRYMDRPTTVGQTRYVVDFERITRTGERQRYIGGAYTSRAHAEAREDALAGRDDCTGATGITVEVATVDNGEIVWLERSIEHSEVCS